MNSSSVTVLVYGMCNMLNVVRAFQHVGADVTVATEPAMARSADRLVVPGVGAFGDSLAEVRRRGFDETIHGFIETTRPFMGICVGMQMLFDGSEEFGNHSGLGIFAGRVRHVPRQALDGSPQRVPHIGWNHLVEPQGGRGWDASILSQCSGNQPAMYFVHSYAACPDNDSDRLADCLYGGHRICAAIQRDNVSAMQFHPERSGEVGLATLRNFMSL